MRQEIIYSLLAVVAVPGVAYADAVQKDAVDITQWTGTGVTLNTGKTILYSNSGETISYSLGQWAKGSYKLNIASISTSESALKVTVAGVTKDVAAAASTAAEVEFTLDAATELTITIESVDKKYFEIGATKLTLVYDFAAAKSTFQTPLTTVINTINDAYTNTNKNSYIVQAAPIQSEINRLKDSDEDGTDAYAAYVQYKLYDEITDEHPLMKQIANLLNEAAYAEKQYLIEQVETGTFATLTTSYEDITDEAAKVYLKAGYEAIKTKIQEYRANAKSKYDEGKANEFDSDGSALTEIKTAITALSGRISSDISANETAYDAVKSAAEKAMGSYLSDLVNTLKDGENQVFSYANLLAIGRQVISDKLAKLQQILDENKASYMAGTAVADKSDSQDDKGNTVKGYDSRISALSTELSAAYTKYATTLKNALIEFESTYATQLSYLTSAEEKYKDVIANHATEHQALKDAVAAVKDAIDTANTGNCEALGTLNLKNVGNPAKNLLDAVTTAKTALVTACSTEQDKATAVTTANQKLTDLDAKWTEAKAAIAELKYGETAVTAYYETIPAGIDEDIKTLKETAQGKNENAEVTGTDEFYTTLDTKITTITDNITTYQTNATSAATKFNEVSETLETARTALATAKDKVKNLGIYADATYNHKVNKVAYNYKTNVEAAEAEIKTADDAIAAAMAKKDNDHVTAVTALSFDATNTNAVVTAINDYYEADQAAWQTAADAAAINAQKAAATSLQSQLDNDKAEIQGEINADGNPLGNAKNEIQTRLNAITYPTAEEVSNIVNANPLNTENLISMITQLNQARTDMDKLKVTVAEAKTRVINNNAIKLTVDGSVSALGWNDTKKAEITTAGGTAYMAGTNGEKDEIDALITAIDEAYTAVNSAISTSYAAETLKEQYTATIKAQIEKIATDIANAKTTAGNLNNNYIAYQAILANANALAKEDAEESEVTIKNAKSAAETADPAAGKSYYSEKLLAVTYANELQQIKDDNETQYKAKSSVASQMGLQGRIDDLKTKIAAAATDATNNLTSYNTIKAIETTVTTTWNNKSQELAQNNESSKLTEYQAKLDKRLAELNTQIAADANAYNNGLSVANQTAAETALAKIKKDIEDLVTEAMEGYDEQISTDNKNMLNAIATEKEKTQAVLKSANETINAYKNVKSEKAKAALDAVKTAYDAVNNTLYEIPTNIKTTWEQAQSAYAATTSPTVFDKDSTYVNQFRTYTTTINTSLTTFLDAVKSALNKAIGTSITTYENSITTYKTTVAGYTLTDDDNKSKVFDALSTKVAEARTAMTDPNITALDAALIALESFDDELKAALNTAAKLDLEPALKAAEADVEKGKAFFADDEEKLTAYETTVGNTIVKAREQFDASTSLSTDYETIAGYIKTYNSNNEYKTANGNNLAYNEIMEKIAEQEKVVDDAFDAIVKAGYGCIEILKTQTDPVGFNKIAETIEGLKTTAEGAKTGTTTYSAMQANIDAITTAVEKLIDKTNNLKTAEKTYLDQRIEDLKAEYNRLAANSKDADAVAAQKEIIDNLVTDIKTAAADNEKTSEDLFAYEAKIKEALADLVKANDGEAGQEGYRAALNSSLDAVAKKAVFAEDVDAAVKAKYEGDMADLVTQVGIVRNEIKDSENPAFDTERIESEIAALDKAVDALNAKIKTDNDAAKAAAAVNQTAYNTKLAELEGYETQISNSKTKLDETFTEATAKSENFAAKYKILEDKIAEAKTKNEELAANGEAISTVDTELQTAVTKGIAAIEDAAAYRQVNAELKNLQAKFAELKAIVVNESNYTPTDLKAINDNKTDIDQRINGTYDTDGNLTKNGLVQDIQSDLTTLESETNLATRQAEIKALLEEIEDTETIINDNKLTPDADPEPDKRGHISSSDEEDITSDDILDLVDIILDNDKLKEADLERCDMDGNQKVDVTDLVWLRYYYVHGKWPTPGTSARTKSADGASMDVTTVSTTDGITRVAINLENSIGFQAIQMDVNLPEGAILRDKLLGERVTDADLLAANKDTGTIRMMILSNDNKAISGSKGPVLYLDIENLQGTVTLSNVTLTDTQYRSHSLGDDPTAIERIKNAVEATGRTIYNLGGKLMDGLKKGINIIRNADGSTKKVVVK